MTRVAAVRQFVPRMASPGGIDAYAWGHAHDRQARVKR
jgi:hypothetical protein